VITTALLVLLLLLLRLPLLLSLVCIYSPLERPKGVQQSGSFWFPSSSTSVPVGWSTAKTVSEGDNFLNPRSTLLLLHRQVTILLQLAIPHKADEILHRETLLLFV